MKIAWLGKQSPGCGNVTYCREITSELLRRNHQVNFLHFASGTDDRDSDCDRSPRTIALPYFHKSVFYTVPSFNSWQVLVDALQHCQFNVLHASLVLSPLDFCLPAICSKLGLPLVVTFHQPFDSEYRTLSARSQQFTYQIYASTLAACQKVIVFSNPQRQLLRKLKVPDDRIAVIPNSVDIHKYSPGFFNIKPEWGAEFLFLYQGRLETEKNVEVLLQVWGKLPKPEGYKLAIVGTGSLEKKLKERYGNDESIIWVGYVQEEKRRIEILRGSDVFVLPSLVEGLSLSLLEAMACGVACIATNAGCHGEVLAGEAGIVIDIQQIEEKLGQILTEFIDRPELASMLGEKAYQRILERYTLAGNVDRVEAIYREFLRTIPNAISYG